jgi:hypothetical protein
MRPKYNASPSKHRGLSGAKSSVTGAFLRTDFAMAAMDLAAMFCTSCTLASGIPLENDSSVKDVFSKRQIEMA